jgi:lipopolysaccharide export system permease protein
MLRISDRYIGRQVLFGTFYAVLVLSLVLIMGNLFKQIRPLLVEQNAPLGVVLRFVLNVLPFSLMFTVPWGFLSAVLLVFGRLSSDQEITGFRVAGVSLQRLAAPVFVIGALLSIGSLWLNLNVVPNAKATVVQLLYDQASSNPASLLRPGVVSGGLGDASMKALIESREGKWVGGFHLYQTRVDADGGRTLNYVHADRAALSVIRERSQLRAQLVNAYFETRKPDGSVEIAIAGNAEPLLIDLQRPGKGRIRPSSMTNEAISAYLAANPDIKPQQQMRLFSEAHKRYSFSMACLAFAFVAVPLGLKARRRDTSGGLLLSLLIGVSYFMFTVLVEQFDTRAGAIAVLWAPNVLCVLLGLYLFRRARFR